jgi:outer membrane protein
MHNHSPFARILVVVAALLLVPGDVNPQSGDVQPINNTEYVLGLQDAVLIALRENPTIREATLQYGLAVRRARAAWGDFEPELTATYEKGNVKRENTPEQAITQGGELVYEEKTDEYGVGVEGRTITGGSYRLGYTVRRQDDSLSEEDQFTSFAGITVDQPVLRGARFGAPLATVRVAEKDRIIAFQEYRKRVMEIISRVEVAYWNLAYAEERLALARDSTNIAEGLVEDSEGLLEAGRLSELDVLEARSGFRLRQTYRADAEQQVVDAEAQLSLLLSTRPRSWERTIAAQDPFLPASPGDLEQRDADSVLGRAWRSQPDYLIRRNEVEREKLLVSYQRDRQLPVLNLSATWGANGLGLTARDAIADSNEQDYPSWSVSADLRIPLMAGIQQRNELAAAKLRVETAEHRLQAAEHDLARTMRVLVQRLNSLTEQFAGAQEVVDLKDEQLEAELELLENGRSTSREVFQIEDELVQAREQALQYILRYRETLSQIAFVSGSSLAKLGLERREGDRFVLSPLLEAP